MRRNFCGAVLLGSLLALSCSLGGGGTSSAPPDCPHRDFIDYGVGIERDLAIPIVEAERAVFRVCVDWECASLKPLGGRLELDEVGSPHFTGRISAKGTGTYFESVVHIGTGFPAQKSQVSIEVTPERSKTILVAEGEIPWTSDRCNPLPGANSL